MPSASKNKRKEAARNKERNRQREKQGAEVKDLKKEESEVEAQAAAALANRDAAEIAKELAEIEIKNKLPKDLTDVEKLRAEQAAMVNSSLFGTGKIKR